MALAVQVIAFLGRLRRVEESEDRYTTATAEMATEKNLMESPPNKRVQHNAGSRPSSGDSSASETPSSLGPRG
jgi:hypothetical protein